MWPGFCKRLRPVKLQTSSKPGFIHPIDCGHICKICINALTLTLTKSYKNYLQNMQHMVLHNHPTLSIGREKLACLNSPLACSPGPSPSTRQVPGLSPGPGGCAARAFFLHPPFLPPSGDSFFAPSPPNPRKC